MRKFPACLLLALLISSAAEAQKLILDPGLDGAPGMNARGRQGWQLNQVIRFGDYTTSKARRGWTKGYDIGFRLRFRKASEKLSFTQKTPDGIEAEVLAVSRFRSTELDMMQGFLSLPVAYENSFAGSVIPAGDAERAWEFVLCNPEGAFVREADCGRAVNEHGETIYVKGLQQMEGMPRWMQAAYFGFEFHKDGRAIAAVSTINNGKVWMLPDLDAGTRLIVAAMSSAILLRHDVSQSIANP